MVSMSEAMDRYFQRLIDKFKTALGCNPLFPWDESDDQSLYVSEADPEDGEAEWLPAACDAVPALDFLCDELRAFFSSRRYWRMAGVLEGVEYTFPSQPTDKAAITEAQIAVREGEYYLGRGYARIALAQTRYNDDLLLMYNQSSGRLSLLDSDRGVTKPLPFTLTELIDTMEAVV